MNRTLIVVALLAAVALFIAVSGCEAKAESKVGSVYTVGKYTVKQIGHVSLRYGELREMIEVTNTETNETRVLIRGFGVADEYKSGKSKHDD